MAGRKIRNMEEFAEVSGISRPTVSKYFHDPGSVRKSTRARIEEALERYEYRPNIFAMNQNRRLTKNIGIVVPYLADPFFAEIARNLERRCIDAGFFPLLFSSHGEQAQENAILDSLRLLKPAGVLLAALGRPSDHDHIKRFCADVPTVLFDSYLDATGAAFVGSDHAQVLRLMVDYLCRSGQPPVYFEMRNPVNPNANRRRAGYVAAMESLGQTPEIVRVDGQGWNFEQIGFDGGGALIERGGFATDTVLCNNDRLAIGLIAAAYAKGVKVGRGPECTLRIAGMDDHPFSQFTCPPMTTIAQDYAAIADRSVETLFNVIENGALTEPRAETLFEGRLVMRDSA
ncbi:MAG: LacI family DNA-binding transcriptional regulator [Marinovum algicola]|jgi:DNA-binding LacI/PurR family transcriptional regulator|uniref:Transcriptional regulator, LacI family n=1 Tax=Marinovum algicola TaxID=42444 RepID=A0A975ZQ46_9RHOB|nr:MULTISPECIES: LacI family DNA-binding transcriptional regulator [Marinovum]MDD9739536.1 LacI family DNA-binding transcriptional regulator [Marinovum sp. SP66]MDD9745418.1 LacI family DNA-binding transcriptional regulator [Marinovum sp. PR37]SEK01113.1 transcriptional regulator, LacI family [Marinovum algicola]SLN44686.1 Ribose operon repressor [Marinovum algicola]